jgi:hypothetical protein
VSAGIVAVAAVVRPLGFASLACLLAAISGCDIGPPGRYTALQHGDDLLVLDTRTGDVRKVDPNATKGDPLGLRTGQPKEPPSSGPSAASQSSESDCGTEVIGRDIKTLEQTDVANIEPDSLRRIVLCEVDRARKVLRWSPSGFLRYNTQTHQWEPSQQH